MGFSVDVINDDITDVRLGEDLSVGFALTDPSTGNPVPVTDWTGTMTLWDFGGNVIATASMVIDNADGGIFHYTIPGATTATFVWQYYRFACSVVQSDGTALDLRRGTVYFEPLVP